MAENKGYDEKEIVLSGDEDISSLNLHDYISRGSMTKVYPYRAIYGNRDKAILQEGTTTIVRISQIGVESFLNLEDEVDKDGNKTGNKYMEIFAVTDNQTQQTLVAGEATFKKDIRNVKSFTAIVNNFFEMQDDKPTFFTIGEPFNEQEFYDGKQIMYYGSTFKPTLESSKQVLQDDFDLQWDIEINDRISEIELQDIAVIEQQFNGAKMLFKTSFINIDSVEDIEIQTLPNMFIDKIKVKGKTKDLNNPESDELIDIDFSATAKDEGNLSWMQVIPINDKDKLEVTLPWFDDDIVLNLSFIKWILSNRSGTDVDDQGVKFSDFIKPAVYDQHGNQTGGGAGIGLLPNSEVSKVILDMLLYTYHFQDSFGTLPRTSTGAIIETATIGYKDKKVSAIANQNPKDVITSIYRRWRKEFPNSVGKTEDKFIKQFVASLSQIIISDLSVAGGENDFNKAILPWRLKLSLPLIGATKTKRADPVPTNIHLKLEDFSFTVDESPYFNFDKISTKKFFDLVSISTKVDSFDFKATNKAPTYQGLKSLERLVDTITLNEHNDKLILSNKNNEFSVSLKDWANKIATETDERKKEWCIIVAKDSEYYAFRFVYNVTGKIIVIFSLKLVDAISLWFYLGLNFESLRIFPNPGTNILQSQYDTTRPGGYIAYNISGDNGEVQLINKEIDLSESKWIESERRIVLPELPEVIDVIDKLNNVGDFSTTTNRDLKYMLKLPLYKEEFERLLTGEDGNYGEKTIIFEGRTLPLKLNPFTYEEAKKGIEEQIKYIYSDATEIKEVKKGYDLVVDDRTTWIGSFFDSTSWKEWIFSGSHVAPMTYDKHYRDPLFEAVIADRWQAYDEDTGGGRYQRRVHIDEWFQNTDDNFRKAWALLMEVIPDQKQRAEFLNLYHDNDGNFAWHVKSNDEDQKVITGIIILEYMKYKKIKDWKDVHVEYIRIETPGHQKTIWGHTIYKFYRKFGYFFTVKHHTWSDYKYTFKTNFPSKELISKQTIYDRPKFKQLVKTAINPDRGIWRSIKLKEKYSIGEYELKEIIISTLFGDTIKLKIGEEIMTIKLEQREDEKLSTKKIYFY